MNLQSSLELKGINSIVVLFTLFMMGKHGVWWEQTPTTKPKLVLGLCGMVLMITRGKGEMKYDQ